MEWQKTLTWLAVYGAFLIPVIVVAFVAFKEYRLTQRQKQKNKQSLNEFNAIAQSIIEEQRRLNSRQSSD